MLDRGNHCGSGDVWVCNSDGYVGQVCILRMGAQIQVRIELFLVLVNKKLSSHTQSTPTFLVVGYDKMLDVWPRRSCRIKPREGWIQKIQRWGSN